MGALGQLVDLLLQGACRPLDCKVDILQQHPSPVFVEVLQVVHGDGLLTLSKRNRGEFAEIGSVTELSPQLFDGGRYVHPRRQKDEDGHTRAGVLEASLQLERYGGDVFLADHVLYELAHGGGQPVRPQGAEDQQALELRHTFPIT